MAKGHQRVVYLGFTIKMAKKLFQYNLKIFCKSDMKTPMDILSRKMENMEFVLLQEKYF
jgi:hypothetical protein